MTVRVQADRAELISAARLAWVRTEQTKALLNGRSEPVQTIPTDPTRPPEGDLIETDLQLSLQLTALEEQTQAAGVPGSRSGTFSGSADATDTSGLDTRGSRVSVVA